MFWFVVAAAAAVAVAVVRPERRRLASRTMKEME